MQCRVTTENPENNFIPNGVGYTTYPDEAAPETCRGPSGTLER